MLPETNLKPTAEGRLRVLCEPFGATLRVSHSNWIEVYQGDTRILLLNAKDVTEQTFLADLLWCAYERGRAQGRNQLQRDLSALLRPDPNTGPSPNMFD